MADLLEIVGSIYIGSMVVLAGAGIAWRMSRRFRQSMVGDHAL